MTAFLPASFDRARVTSLRRLRALDTALHDAELWFGALTMRFALLRPKELCQLRLGDVRVRSDKDADGTMVRLVTVLVRTTKTSPSAFPPAVMVARPDFLCPVAAFRAVLLARASADADATLTVRDKQFLLSTLGRTTAARQNKLGKLLRAKVAASPAPRPVEPAAFTSYSRRRGGTTDMVASGVDARLIQAQGRWLNISSLDAYYAGNSAPALRMQVTLQLSYLIDKGISAAGGRHAATGSTILPDHQPQKRQRRSLNAVAVPCAVAAPEAARAGRGGGRVATAGLTAKRRKRAEAARRAAPRRRSEHEQ